MNDDRTCYGTSGHGPGIRAWIDGELTTAEAASLAEHVERCPACQAEKREQEAAGDEIASAVRGMAAASGAARERLASRLGRRPLPSWAVAAAAAVVVTGGVLGIAAVGWPGTGKREPVEVADGYVAPAPRRETAPVPPEVEAVVRAIAAIPDEVARRKAAVDYVVHGIMPGEIELSPSLPAPTPVPSPGIADSTLWRRVGNVGPQAVQQARDRLDSLLAVEQTPAPNPTIEEAIEMYRAVEELGDDSWSVRETASERLLKFGRRAQVVLGSAAQSADPEVAHRARVLLAAIDPPWGGEVKQAISLLVYADSGEARDFYARAITLVQKPDRVVFLVDLYLEDYGFTYVGGSRSPELYVATSQSLARAARAVMDGADGDIEAEVLERIAGRLCSYGTDPVFGPPMPDVDRLEAWDALAEGASPVAGPAREAMATWEREDADGFRRAREELVERRVREAAAAAETRARVDLPPSPCGILVPPLPSTEGKTALTDEELFDALSSPDPLVREAAARVLLSRGAQDAWRAAAGPRPAPQPAEPSAGDPARPDRREGRLAKPRGFLDFGDRDPGWMDIWQERLTAVGVDAGSRPALRRVVHGVHAPLELDDRARRLLAGAITRLGDGDWQTREAASEEALTVVREFGRSAVPMLEAAAASNDPEVAHRAGILLIVARSVVSRDVYEAAFGCLLAQGCSSTEDWAGLYRLWMWQLQEAAPPVGLALDEWTSLLHATGECLSASLADRSGWGAPPGETAGTVALLVAQTGAYFPAGVFARQLGERTVDAICRGWLTALVGAEPPAERSEWSPWVVRQMEDGAGR